MSLTKRFLLGYLVVYIFAISGIAIYTGYSARTEIYTEVAVLYEEHFRIAEYNLNLFFKGIEEDLATIASCTIIQNADDKKFTSFLEADEKTFQYHYTPLELSIIEIFNNYRLTHPHVNSVYMGRSNGSFVRSHPRSIPTAYDPRIRPWYQQAITFPDNALQTEAYTSVSTPDINIGTVMALKNNKKQVTGVIGIDVTLDALSEEFSKMALSYNGKMEIYEKDGRVIISPWPERLNHESNDNDTYHFEYLSTNVKIEKGAIYYRITKVQKLANSDYNPVAYVPIQEIDALISAGIYERILFVTYAMLIFAVVTYFMLEVLILQPIRGMREALSNSKKNRMPLKMTLSLKGELEDFQSEYNQLVSLLEADETELQKVKALTVISLSSLAEMRDYETGLHIVRTQKYVEMLAEHYNIRHIEAPISESKLAWMVQCAPLHDIGKVAIPDNILLKPGPLTNEEFNIMKRHTIIGKDSIDRGNAGISDNLFIETASNIVLYHHERWDGTGYPTGLYALSIPIEARIMSIADVYDALTSKRVYKKAIPHEAALKIMVEGRGTQFDPSLIDLFLEIAYEFKIISELYRED